MIIKRIKNFIIKYIMTSNKQKIKYLKKQGAIIGDKTRIYCGVEAFGSEPYLIKVGKDCLLTANIHLLTHDGGIKVLNSLGYFGEKRMDKMGTIEIGDNVFIGNGVYILPNVKIGNNVIIGCNSVVTKNIPNNVVIAGVPAKVICTIEEYYERNKKDLLDTTGLNFEEKKNIIIKKFNNL